MKRVILFSLVVLFVLSSNAFAYTFTEDFDKGFYWKTFPLMMKKFVANSNDGALLDDLIGEVEEEWEQAVGMEIWNFEEGHRVSSSYSGNFVRWSDDFANETGYDANSTLAVTIRFISGTHVIRTEIILNGGLFYLRNNQNGILRQTLLHEIGHTIGLGHTDMPGIMRAYVGSYHHLERDDIDGVIEVINTAQYRQATGYTSPSAGDDRQETSLATCGSIDLNGSGPSGGMFSFLLSLLIGLFMGKIFLSGKKLLKVF